MPHAIVYARVSTDAQADRGLSIPGQLAAIHAYAKAQGITIVREFVDEGKTATNDARPEFQALIQFARDKRNGISQILVYQLSRFSRSVEDAAVYRSLLRKSGVQVISMTEAVDDTATGRMMAGILDVINEYDSSAKGDATRRGKRQAVRNGFMIGGRPPYGYQFAKESYGNGHHLKLVPDALLTPIVRRIFQLYLGGESCRSIAHLLQAERLASPRGTSWQSGTVHWILTNEAYLGTAHYGRGQSDRLRQDENIIRTLDAHEALIDRATWETVQRRLVAQSPAKIHPRQARSEYLLSGLLYCRRCGWLMHGSSTRSPVKDGMHLLRYYRCGKRSANGGCEQQGIRMEQLEEPILEILGAGLLNEEVIAATIQEVNHRLAATEKAMSKITTHVTKQLAAENTKLERLYQAIEKGVELEDIGPRIKDVRARIVALEKEAKEAQHLPQEPSFLPAEPQKVQRLFREWHSLLTEGSTPEKKMILRGLVEKVEAETGHGVVYGTIPLGEYSVMREFQF